MLKENRDEIPEILNTIENDYSKIYLIGKGQYAFLVEQYFRMNQNIILEKLLESDFKETDGKLFLNREVSGDEIIVFADERLEKPVIGQNRKGFQTFYFSRFYHNVIKTTENLQDIDQNIIPKLLNSGVHVIKVYVPDLDRLHGKEQIKMSMHIWSAIRHVSSDMFDFLRRKKEHTEFLKKETGLLSNDNSKGYSLMYGNGQYINFDNGFRRTTGNPPGDINQIYFFGPCFIRGLGCTDDCTIPSLIQKRVGKQYRVLNYGSEFQTVCYIMRMLEYKVNDMVIIFSPDRKSADKKVDDRLIEMDLTDVFNRVPHIERHIFDLPVHFDKTIQNEIVNAICEKIVSSEGGLKSQPVEKGKKVIFGPRVRRAPDLKWEKNEAFHLWICEMQSRFPIDCQKIRGAIVMNCNPFTNGHRYLIETASKQVDELIIFVVEEDKSVFQFEDRIRLVKLGTEDLANVIVAESGKYMISSSTLPGYFDKSKLQDTYLDAGNDLMLFTKIAQNLNISVRFVGEEPLDQFTEQYNRSMESILTRYGIQFVEIPRKMEGNDVISASRVRAMLLEKNWKEIEKMVPKTTYDFLLNM